MSHPSATHHRGTLPHEELTGMSAHRASPSQDPLLVSPHLFSRRHAANLYTHTTAPSDLIATSAARDTLPLVSGQTV